MSMARWPRTILFTAFLFSLANALHFYLEANEKRCFIEELPSDTIVEGAYRALEWDEKTQSYENKTGLGIQVDVVEIYSGEEVVKSRGPNEGRFTFTSHEAGDHSICLSTNYTAGWFSSAHIRLYLDIIVGSTKPDAEHDRSHASQVVSRLRELNLRLEEIRREQQYQREREASFRDLSEATNSKAVWYIIAQITVLIITCTWQLRHLRKFFADRKS